MYQPNQIEERPYPNARANVNAPIEAFGGGEAAASVTRASNQLVEQALGIAMAEQKKADDFATMKAYDQAVKLKNELEWDPKKGAMTKQGENAFGIIDNYTPLLAEGLSKIESTLSRDQAAMFAKVKSNVTNDFNSNLSRHLATETEI
jgi:hypothetical protein